MYLLYRVLGIVKISQFFSCLWCIRKEDSFFTTGLLEVMKLVVRLVSGIRCIRMGNEVNKMYTSFQSNKTFII
jgi:hypothetical protein